ncbi:MAG TPA: hypothetical protein VGS57_21605 [Thermoanaerobaculia bacterium]|jgi:hypothetical protein|nr:hypothetical protein [Thermoanaerobaculia bacterium]
MASPVRSTIREVPPSLATVAGIFVGSTSGTTVQRLLLNADGTGDFVNVAFNSSSNKVSRYNVRVRSFTNWKIALDLVSASGARPIRATGELRFFDASLRLPAMEGYRARSIRLFREQTLMSMMETAREAMASAPHQQ